MGSIVARIHHGNLRLIIRGYANKARPEKEAETRLREIASTQGPRWLRKLAHEKGRRMFAPRYGCVQPRLIRQVMRFSASFIRSGDGETRDSQTCRRVHAAMLDKRHSRSWNWSTRPSEDSSWNIMSTQRGICKKEIGFDGSYSRRKEEFWSSFAQAPNLPLHASLSFYFQPTR